MPLPQAGPAGTSGPASTHALPHPAPPSSPAVPVVVPAAPAVPRKPVPPAPAVPPPVPPMLPAAPPAPCASGAVRSDFVPAQASAVMNNVEIAIRYSGPKRFTLDTVDSPQIKRKASLELWRGDSVLSQPRISIDHFASSAAQLISPLTASLFGRAPVVEPRQARYLAAP